MSGQNQNQNPATATESIDPANLGSQDVAGQVEGLLGVEGADVVGASSSDGYGVDTYEVDLSGDGIPEVTAHDDDNDGRIDLAEVDTDGDRITNTIIEDREGDGVRDEVSTDTNNDGYVETTADALRLIQAARCGLIPRITRRLNELERRSMIKSGAIFVFSVDESGIKRWTDGAHPLPHPPHRVACFIN